MAADASELWPADATPLHLVSAKVNCSGAELFHNLWNKSDISLELHKQRGDVNLKESTWVSSRAELPEPQFAWEPAADASKATCAPNRFRKARFESPPTAMSSKPFQNEELQHCTAVVPSTKFTVDVKANTSAPYGDKFHIYFRYSIYCLSEASSALTVTFHVQFLPGMNYMLKPVVSRAVDGGIRGTFKTFRAVLGTAFVCEDVAEAALMEMVRQVLPTITEVLRVPIHITPRIEPAVCQHEPPAEAAPAAVAGLPHHPAPRSLFDFFSDQLVYQEQVVLLSEVATSSLKYISNQGILARVLGMALTIWLIHLAVLVCNGLQSICTARQSPLLLPLCWPLGWLIDLPDSTGEVLSSLMLVAILNWAAIRGYELLLEYMRQQAASATPSATTTMISTATVSPMVVAAAALTASLPAAAASVFGTVAGAKSMMDAMASTSTAVKAPIRAAPPAKPFPESVKKMVQDTAEKAETMKKMKAAADAATKHSESTQKKTGGSAAGATTAAGVTAAGATTEALRVTLSSDSVTTGAGIKSPPGQSIEMSPVGKSHTTSDRPAHAVSPAATEPRDAAPRRSQSTHLEELALGIPTGGETEALKARQSGSQSGLPVGLTFPDAAVSAGKPPLSPREDAQRLAEEVEETPCEQPPAGQYGGWMQSMTAGFDSFKSVSSKRRPEDMTPTPSASAGPAQIRRAVTMLYDVMPASKRPNYVAAFCKTASESFLDLAHLRHRDMEVEEIFENERFQPFRGWGHLWPGHFLPSDRVGHWSDRQGRPGGSASMDFEQVVPGLPSEEEWYWLDADWVLDLDGVERECVDAEGWSYALDFNFFKFPNMPGCGKCTMKHFVRRRRWIRTRARIMQRGLKIEEEHEAELADVEHVEEGQEEEHALEEEREEEGGSAEEGHAEENHKHVGEQGVHAEGHEEEGAGRASEGQANESAGSASEGQAKEEEEDSVRRRSQAKEEVDDAKERDPGTVFSLSMDPAKAPLSMDPAMGPLSEVNGSGAESELPQLACSPSMGPIKPAAAGNPRTGLAPDGSTATAAKGGSKVAAAAKSHGPGSKAKQHVGDGADDDRDPTPNSAAEGRSSVAGGGATAAARSSTGSTLVSAAPSYSPQPEPTRGLVPNSAAGSVVTKQTAAKPKSTEAASQLSSSSSEHLSPYRACSPFSNDAAAAEEEGEGDISSSPSSRAAILSDKIHKEASPMTDTDSKGPLTPGSAGGGRSAKLGESSSSGVRSSEMGVGAELGHAPGGVQDDDGDAATPAGGGMPGVGNHENSCAAGSVDSRRLHGSSGSEAATTHGDVSRLGEARTVSGMSRWSSWQDGGNPNELSPMSHLNPGHGAAAVTPAPAAEGFQQSQQTPSSAAAGGGRQPEFKSPMSDANRVGDRVPPSSHSAGGAADRTSPEATNVAWAGRGSSAVHVPSSSPAAAAGAKGPHTLASGQEHGTGRASLGEGGAIGDGGDGGAKPPKPGSGGSSASTEPQDSTSFEMSNMGPMGVGGRSSGGASRALELTGLGGMVFAASEVESDDVDAVESLDTLGSLGTETSTAQKESRFSGEQLRGARSSSMDQRAPDRAGDCSTEANIKESRKGSTAKEAASKGKLKVTDPGMSKPPTEVTANRSSGSTPPTTPGHAMRPPGDAMLAPGDAMRPSGNASQPADGKRRIDAPKLVTASRD